MSKGWVPDQHGAWVMVTVPLLLGIGLAGPTLLHIPLAIAWYTGYFAFFAVSWWLRARGKRKREYVPALVTYTALCAAAGLPIVLAKPSVLGWAAVFGPLMSIAVYEAYRRRPRSLLSGISTVLASTAMIPLASFVAGEPITTHEVVATVIVGMYFCGTIFYVKSLIRERRNVRFGYISVAVHAIFTVIAAVISPWAGLVFAALTFRAWLMPWWGHRRPKPWSPKLVGLTEMVATLIVVATAVMCGQG